MTGKRWAGVDAYEHIQLVEAGILPRGLSYLSAYDYIGLPVPPDEEAEENTQISGGLNAGYQ